MNPYSNRKRHAMSITDRSTLPAGVPQRLYLAGPMSGYSQHNFPLFNRIAAQLREQGFEVFNPAENFDGDVRKPRAFYMKMDIPALIESQAVVVLPGWRESRGANLEVWLALDMGMPLYNCTPDEPSPKLTPLADLRITELPFQRQASPTRRDHSTARPASKTIEPPRKLPSAKPRASA